MHHREPSYPISSFSPRSGVSPSMAIAILAFAGLFATVTAFGLAHSMLPDRGERAGLRRSEQAEGSVPALSSPDGSEVVAAAPAEVAPETSEEQPEVVEEEQDLARPAARPRPSSRRGPRRSNGADSDSEPESAPTAPAQRNGIAPLGGTDPLEGIGFGGDLDA
jgi:hypothetical protein